MARLRQGDDGSYGGVLMTRRIANPRPRGDRGQGRPKTYARLAIPLDTTLTVFWRSPDGLLRTVQEGVIQMTDAYPVTLLRLVLANGDTLEICNVPPLKE